MKKWAIIFVCLAVVSVFSQPVEAKKDGSKPACATIQSGTILASDGAVIETGYDQWGYNYQAHIFNGYYCDAYRDAAWCRTASLISFP
ncbi:MAG: hypothetical protein V1793_04525 [Pseudomonadota bacterium]